MTLSELRQQAASKLFAHYRAEAFERNRVEITDTDEELEVRFGAAIDEILSRMLTDYTLGKYRRS